MVLVIVLWFLPVLVKKSVSIKTAYVLYPGLLVRIEVDGGILKADGYGTGGPHKLF